MTAKHRWLMRMTLALFLMLSQGLAVAHGVDHLAAGDPPACATCVAGQTLTDSNHGCWELILPLARHCWKHGRPARAFAGARTGATRARAPPAPR